MSEKDKQKLTEYKENYRKANKISLEKKLFFLCIISKMSKTILNFDDVKVHLSFLKIQLI